MALMSGKAESGAGSACFVRRRASDGAYWNVVGFAFEAYQAGNVGQYGIPAGEQVASSGWYTADDPAPAVEGDYELIVKAGANLAASDLEPGSRWHERVPAAAPTAAQNAAAWGARELGNGRTADMFLMGYANRIDFAADGLSATLYSFDDVTVLQELDATRLPTSVGGLRSVAPA
jgi:hypothetical protein